MSLLQLLLLACSVLPGPPAPSATAAGGGERDSDRDGLSDFQELHKYFTDPRKADSDGDGLPDGDWDERREYAYSVRAVMHVMAPFDVESMNDDYQDVRVLERRADLLEFEVVVYPFNTVAAAIEPDSRWRKTASELEPFVAPGVCSNWDKSMQKELLSDLAEDGIAVSSLDDVETAREVSRWLLERAGSEDSFTTFAVEFEKGRPHVVPQLEGTVERTLEERGRTLEEQWNHELFGKGMFETRTRGSCTSSAIYLSTGLKAVGLPTRTIVCVPIVDANDEREVAWIGARIMHSRVRRILARAAEEQRGSWTSHTFNEVWVGGRWRRLNYTNLGQNVLDGDSLGLMVHVNTFNDHSQAGLVGWGRRLEHPLHDALFGGPNPYSCVSLSDHFGAHCELVDEPDGPRELTITGLLWYDDPKRSRRLETSLPDDRAGYLVAHFERGSASGSEALRFWQDLSKDFVLRAEGADDVPALGIQKFWGDSADFILRIAPSDLERLRPGVRYRLEWPSEGGQRRWRVADDVGIERARR